jgi:hypothetical protein
MSTFEPTEPPAADDVPPAPAAAPPDTPGTAPMPGMLLPLAPPTFMPCVLPVFCEAEVD